MAGSVLSGRDSSVRADDFAEAEPAGRRKFERQLFISYAHLDNEPLGGQREGWVSQFHRSVGTMLSMRMGRKVEIWRDEKLRGSDIFSDEILVQLPKAALLISILTPRYVDSEWCTREVREFCKEAEKTGGVVIENKSRVIKVIKTPVEDEGPLPPLMKDTLGYPFYVFSDEHAPLELDPAFGPEIAQKYNVKVANLVWDISQQLKKLGVTAKDPEPVCSKPTIYLAECSWDQRQARETLEAELRRHGYPILPDRQLSRDETCYVGEVAKLLEKSKFSIHLVGATYGAVPDGPTQKSIVVLQNELAVERSRGAGLRRVIWVPEGTSSRQVEQQQFIDTLHNSAEAQFGADLMVCDLETLKESVHRALERLQKPEQSPPREPLATRLVYLICDERDRRATIPLRRFLINQGFQVEIPVFEGDAATVRQRNQDLFTQCDGIILFYGAGDELWKRTVDSDLRKMKGYRDLRRITASFTYLAEPVTDHKSDLIEMEEPHVMNGLGGFSESVMQPFIQMFRSE
jgi:hypothetical protein